MKNNNKLALLTPQEDSFWEFCFNYYKDAGKSDSRADEAAWQDMKKEFPRLKKYKGCR